MSYIIVHLADVNHLFTQAQNTLRTWIVPIAGIGWLISCILWVGGGWIGNASWSDRGMKGVVACFIGVVLAFSVVAALGLAKSIHA